MGTSFSVRYGILALVIFLVVGCQKGTNFQRNYLIVSDTLIDLKADSTTIGYINSGSAKRLFSGIDSTYKSYALFQFIFSADITFDSLRFKIMGDSVSDTVYLISINEDWDENTVNFGMRENLLGDTFRKLYVNGDSVSFLVDKDTFLKYIANHGFAIYNKGWQKYYSKESSVAPKLYIYSDSTIIKTPYRDAYIGADTSETIGVYRDTMIVETGMWSKVYFGLPLDIINEKDKIISAHVLVSARDTFLNQVECIKPGDTIKTISDVSGLYPDKTEDLDVLKAIDSSYTHLVIEPYDPATTPSQTSIRSDSFKLYLIYKHTEPTWRSGL